MMMLLTGATGAADRNSDGVGDSNGNGYRVGENAAAGNERHNVWLGLGVGVSVSSTSSRRRRRRRRHRQRLHNQTGPAAAARV